ncbi:hypothetical protein Ancab_040186 [Ancistrocladus abbreviatus]
MQPQSNISNYLEKILSLLAFLSFLLFSDGVLRLVSHPVELPPLVPLYICATCIFLLNWDDAIKFAKIKLPTSSGRVAEPSDFKFEIQNYRELLDSAERTGSHRIESSEFNAGGHSWVLVMFPNGNEDNNGSGHVSLYLRLVNKPTGGGAVLASVKFFIFNKLYKSYVTINSTSQDARFDASNFEWGIAQALPIKDFQDETKGLLLHNSCTIGVEVSVITNTTTVACLSLLANTTHRTKTWLIDNFSKLKTEEYLPSFHVEGFSWKLYLYPRGHRTGKDRYLSLCLFLEDHVDLIGARKLYVECMLSIKDKHSGNNHKKTIGCWFDSTNYRLGIEQFIPLADLNNPNNGYIDDDKLFIEANLNTIFTLQEIKKGG